ncbi:MAG: hypothetical protein WBF07_20005 [Xanthobacteraceae bacterium]
MFKPSFRFNFGDEAIEDLVEQLHVFLAERGRTSNKKAGDAIEYGGPPVLRAALDDIFERGERRGVSTHADLRGCSREQGGSQGVLGLEVASFRLRRRRRRELRIGLMLAC